MSTLKVEHKEQMQTAESTQDQETLKMKIQEAKRQGKPVVVIGLDVHKNFNKYSAIETSLTGECYSGTLSSHSSDLLKVIHEMEERYGKDTLIITGYESGPTGMRLCRDILREGYSCQIIPAKDAKRFQVNKRIKTDQRDAYAVMCCLREQDFNPVYVLEDEDEQTRLYIRMRDDTEDSLKRLQHQINAFMLQLGKRYKPNKEKKNCRGSHCKWTQPHLEWLRTVKLDETARQTLNEYLAQYDFLKKQLARYDKKIKAICQGKRYIKRVRVLRAFPGVDWLTALSFISEIGDFDRFETASRFASFLGLVPGEHSSGGKQAKTSITKTGNRHLRRLAVLAARAMIRTKGQLTNRTREKQKDCPEALLAYIQRCHWRVWTRFNHLIYALNKQRNVAYVAAARELACFIWGSMTGHIA